MTASRIDVKQMRDHVAAICAEAGIRVTGHSRGGRASRQGRIIAIRPVKSAITYAVALHEIGHILGPWQSQPRLFAEAGAWKWAIDNALIWSPVMQRKMVKSLASYVLWAERRKRVRLPEAGHEFWRLVETPRAERHALIALHGPRRRTRPARRKFWPRLRRMIVR